MNWQQKVNTFGNLPNDQLTRLSDEPKNEGDISQLRSIEKELQDTKTHINNTSNSGDNTDNIPNPDQKPGEGEDISVDQPTKKNRLGKLMGGTFAVDLVDMLIPSLAVYLIRLIGYEFEKKHLQLTKQEKEALSPAVQDVLDEISLDFSNPYINLGVMIAIVYGTKVIDKLPELKKKKEPKEERGITESIVGLANNVDEEVKEKNPLLIYEIEYGKLVDEVKNKRKRGVGDAQMYLATNYSTQIRAIATKCGISEDHELVQKHLNWVHNPKKREKRSDRPDFEI